MAVARTTEHPLLLPRRKNYVLQRRVRNRFSCCDYLARRLRFSSVEIHVGRIDAVQIGAARPWHRGMTALRRPRLLEIIRRPYNKGCLMNPPSE